ncbi:unnamed protein product [Penicillium discolor]
MARWLRIIGPQASQDCKGKGKGKAVAGPSTPSKGTKRRAAEESSAEKEKTSKQKKKKAKEVPEPPARVDATPCSGPVFDSVLYQTPLDWPMVYRAEDELLSGFVRFAHAFLTITTRCVR